MANVMMFSKYLRNFGGISTNVRYPRKGRIVQSIVRYDTSMTSQRYTVSNSYLEANTNSVNGNMKTLDLALNGEMWVTKNNILQAIKKLNSPASVSSSKALQLIRCCGNAIIDYGPSERTEVAKELWTCLQMHNIQIGVFHYNELLEVYFVNGYKFSPMEFLSEMEKKHIKPDIKTYETLIKCCCQQGNITDSIQLLEQMKEVGFSVTEPIFSSLIRGYSEAGDMENALKMVDIMEENGITLSSKTYISLMCAYAKTNDISKINDIMSGCQQKNIYLTQKDISDVISVLIANHHKEHLCKMFETMTMFPHPSYNPHFVMQLVEVGEIDLALKALEKFLVGAKINNLQKRLVNVFISKLIKSNLEVDKIIDVCVFLENKKINYAMLEAVKQSMLSDNIELNLSLLKAAHDMHYYIRPHYFWPILVKTGNKHDFRGVLGILEQMVTKFKIVPCIKTIKDFVLPYTFGSPNTVYEFLQLHQVPKSVINNAIVYNLLNTCKIRKALQHIKSFPEQYYYNEVEYALRSAVFITKDINSFVQICKVFDNSNSSNYQTQMNYGACSTISISDQLQDFIIDLPHYKSLLMQIIVELSETMTYLPPEAEKMIRNHLSDYITPEVNEALKKMSNAPLKKITSNTESTVYRSTQSANIRTVALQKVIRLVKTTDVDNACKYLTQNPAPNVTEESQLDCESLLLNIYNIPTAMLKVLIDKLVMCNYMYITPRTMKFLTDAYIRDKNLVAAVGLFCDNLKTGLWTLSTKHRLTKELICVEEHNLLQRLIDECTKVENKSNVLIDLLFDFLECNRMKQVQKIIETDETLLKHGKVVWNLTQHAQNGNNEIVYQFLELIEDMNLDKVHFYSEALKIYISTNDAKMVLNLYQRMQEKNIQPPISITIMVSNLLKRHKLEFPEIPPPNVETKHKEENTNVKMEKEGVETCNSQDMKIIL